MRKLYILPSPGILSNRIVSIIELFSKEKAVPCFFLKRNLYSYRDTDSITCLSSFMDRINSISPCMASPTYTYMKKIFSNPIDFSKVDTLVYHLPDGPSFSVEMQGVEELFDLEMEVGDICDTSEIDGVVHFFPRGNA